MAKRITEWNIQTIHEVLPELKLNANDRRYLFYALTSFRDEHNIVSLSRNKILHNILHLVDNDLVPDSIGIPIQRAFIERRNEDGLTDEEGGMLTKWTDHVKAYCKKHGCSYKEGLQKAKHTYKKGGMMRDNSLAQRAYNAMSKESQQAYDTDAETGNVPRSNKVANFVHNHPARVAQAQREERQGTRIRNLHQQFTAITGIILDVQDRWDIYEAMIAYYETRGISELDFAMLPRDERERLINRYMYPIASYCVASGLRKKKGGMVRTQIAESREIRNRYLQLPSQTIVRMPIYTRAQANDFEHNRVPIPLEIADIAGLIHQRFPQIAHVTFVATLLHSVGWTPEDIFMLLGNDIPAFRRLIAYLAQNTVEYLIAEGGKIKGSKKKMKGGALPTNETIRPFAIWLKANGEYPDMDRFWLIQYIRLALANPGLVQRRNQIERFYEGYLKRDTQTPQP